MELQFEPRPLHYLCKVLQETKCQEETIETIVPDSYPDVQQMLCGSAFAAVRSKECHTGCVTVSGGIQAKTMYMAEGETTPRCLEAYLPFHVKVESAGLTESAQTMFRVWVRNVDVRMLNSRKIVIRVNLCWELTAYDRCEETLYDLREKPEELQTNMVEYTLPLPVETAQRDFQMTEKMSFPAARPLVGDVYRFMPRLELTEKRLAGNKAVFKGVACFKTLYGTEGGTLATQEMEIPFSQYCELSNVYEEDEMDLQLLLSGCETERMLMPEGETLSVTLQILAQCVVKQKKTVQMVQDAYCIGGDLSPRWSQYAFQNRLDRQAVSTTVRESREMNVADVVQVWTTQEPVQTARVADGMQITAPVNVSVLYLDGAGEYHYTGFRSEVTEKISLHEKATCHVQADVSGDVTAIPAGGGLELRYPVLMTLESYADETYRCLCGGEMQMWEEKKKNRPAVIARRTRSGETLWDIAKASGTTVEKIRRANHLDADATEAGVLLIPT